jgi:hypothetical protein
MRWVWFLHGASAMATKSSFKVGITGSYGGLNLIYALGYTVGPLIGGWLLGHHGADTAYALIAVMSVVLATLLATPMLRRAQV